MRPQLAAMRDGATFVNTARGAIVDTDALVDELSTGRISAVLDVTDPEPLPPGHPLWSMANVFLTPHVAGAQGSELVRLADLAVTEIERFVAGEPPLHPVRDVGPVDGSHDDGFRLGLCSVTFRACRPGEVSRRGRRRARRHRVGRRCPRPAR